MDLATATALSTMAVTALSTTGAGVWAVVNWASKRLVALEAKQDQLTAERKQLQDDWDAERRSSLLDKEQLREQIGELEKQLAHTEAKLQNTLDKLAEMMTECQRLRVALNSYEQTAKKRAAKASKAVKAVASAAK
jgi:septal ring factor EnvC (AmiA/AmiB activator)